MSAAKSKKPVPADSMTLLVPATQETPAVVKVVAGGVPDLYFACELPCDVDGSRNFEVVGYRSKLRGYDKATRRYNVLVQAPRPNCAAIGSCECEGGTYRPDRGACRHIRMLAALWSRGMI